VRADRARIGAVDCLFKRSTAFMAAGGAVVTQSLPFRLRGA